MNASRLLLDVIARFELATFCISGSCSSIRAKLHLTEDVRLELLRKFCLRNTTHLLQSFTSTIFDHPQRVSAYKDVLDCHERLTVSRCPPNQLRRSFFQFPGQPTYMDIQCRFLRQMALRITHCTIGACLLNRVTPTPVCQHRLYPCYHVYLTTTSGR